MTLGSGVRGDTESAQRWQKWKGSFSRAPLYQPKFLTSGLVKDKKQGPDKPLQMGGRGGVGGVEETAGPSAFSIHLQNTCMEAATARYCAGQEKKTGHGRRQRRCPSPWSFRRAK